MEIEYLITKSELNQRFRLILGDITDQTTDIIVNAANEDLILGAGVAGAIRRKGGPKIQKECNSLGKTPTGKAQITSAGNLKAKYVVHAVGPIYDRYSSQEAKVLLSDAVLNSLKILKAYNLSSITFPAISTGIFGFPKELAATTIIKAIFDFLENEGANYIIQICLFSENDLHLFQKAANNIFS